MSNTTPASFVYHYFFSFCISTPTGQNFGNGTLDRTAPIRSIDHINQITRETARNAGVPAENVVLLSYSLLHRTEQP